LLLEQLLAENARLRERVRSLEEEARELSSLVREHERALESVMDQFRAQAVGKSVWRNGKWYYHHSKITTLLAIMIFD
jgi:uncharacterized protein YlxW (UPF0749 family)